MGGWMDGYIGKYMTVEDKRKEWKEEEEKVNG